MTIALRRDLARAIRRAWRDRIVSTTIVVTLALGIGASTTIFSVVHAILLRPLPYRASSELVSIGHRSASSARGPMLVSAPGFQDYQRKTRSFSAVAVENETGMNLTGTGAAQRLTVLRVSGDWFRVYGVPPLRGRTLSPDDQVPGRDRVAVLTYGLWQRAFGSDSAVVGRTIALNGQPYQVVGVMPSGFSSFFKPHSELVVPLALTAQQLNGPYASANYQLTARLGSGAGIDGAAAEMRAVGDRLRAERGAELPRGFWLTVRSLDDLATADARPALLLLVGAVGFLLVIACANIANLLMARAAVRAREMSLRSALGASRADVIRQLLTESIALALAGGVLGVGLAYVSLRVVLIRFPDLPRATEIGIDPAALCFALLVSIATGLLFGTAPALQTSRVDLAGALRDGGRSGTTNRFGRRVLGSLVVVEMALAFVLLVVTGLLLQSMKRLRAIDTGFDSAHTAVFKVSLPPLTYPTDTSQRQFVRALTERLRAIPGVRAVGTTSVLPFSGNWWTASVMVEGQVVPAGQELPVGDLRIVSPGFFAAMRIGVKAGRVFDEQDTDGKPLVTIVDELFAKRFFRGSPIGQRIALDPQPGQRDSLWMTVVGVVSHTAHEGLDAPWRIQYYFPYAQRPVRNIAIALGTSGPPSGVLAAARVAVQELDRDLPLSSATTMLALVESSLSQRRLSLMLLTAFSTIAITLACVGIYGLLSYSVARRARELGIRRALGGSRARLLLLVLRQGMALVAAGLAVGLVVGGSLTRLLGSQLYDVRPQDPGVFVAGAALLFAVAGIATLVPAIRATTADPMTALRAE